MFSFSVDYLCTSLKLLYKGKLRGSFIILKYLLKVWLGLHTTVEEIEEVGTYL